jgi:lipoyl-dependent peroxiredoxin subunit C
MPALMHEDVSPRYERMLTVGDVIPEFRLPALAATVGRTWELDSAWLRGRWLALLYWPRQPCLQSVADIAELARSSSTLTRRDTQFVAACGGLDPDRRISSASGESSDMPFPVVVDVRGELAVRLGIQRTLQAGGHATFVADPSGLVRWAGATDLSPLDSLREAAGVVATLTARPRTESGAPAVCPDPQAAAGREGSRRVLIRACAWCRRLKDETGWHTPEAFIGRRTGAKLSHGICTECLEEQSSG